MKKYLFLVVFVALTGFMLDGRSHVVSKKLREQVTAGLTFQEIIKEPTKYQGKIVLWGGLIIESTNTKEGTLIKVLQTSIDSRGQPYAIDVSQSRFLILYPGYLDGAIYCQGRKIIVIGEIQGEIQGEKTIPLGEIKYTYPLVLAKEIYLWERDYPRERAYWIHPYYYPYYPGWWSYPAW